MKSFIKTLLTAILGGAIAFGAFKYFDNDTVIIEQVPYSNQVSTASITTAVSAVSDFVTAADKANPAVVHISAMNEEYVQYSEKRNKRSYDPFEDMFYYRRNRDRPQAGTGSGVLISDNGHIVTNNHVVGFADFVEVTLYDGNTYKAQKIGTDPSTDLAVLKIEGNGQRFPHLDFSNSDDVRVGEWVVAVGNPFNLTSTVTAGIVSAKGRDLDIIGSERQRAIEEFIQTDAVVNPGNSGGALVNTIGELIGINTAISSPTGVYAGYSFAIPSNLVRRVVDEIITAGGDIKRAYLGIIPYNVTDVIENDIKVPTDKGVYVADFNVDRYGRKGFSSAEYAGVEIGDVIVQVNQMNTDDSGKLREALKFVKVGDTVDLRVNRKGKEKTIKVKIKQGL